MPTSPSNARPATPLVSLPVQDLSPAPGGQARQHFDPATLQGLAASVKRSGIREPIIVTPDESAPGGYRIVAGERRWRAAQLAGARRDPVPRRRAARGPDAAASRAGRGEPAP
jgi:ParB family transcriptional regulator, chromosome partitioning protein